MVIDLHKVMSYIHTELTKQNVRAVIADLYPKEKMWRNVLASAVGCGIVAEIQKAAVISPQRLNAFASRLADNFGVQENIAREAVKMWIDVFHGNGAAGNKIKVEAGENAVSGYPKSLESNDGNYVLNALSQETAEIEKFIGSDSLNMEIPESIDGRRIIGIGSNAFAECSVLREITIAEGIEYIGRECFYRCRNLHVVNLPKTLTQLGSNAFSYTEIKEIKLPEALTALPDGVFRFCRQLRRINIGSNIKLIADFAFCGCEALSEINIAEGLEQLGSQVFDRCKNLHSVVLPKSLKFIDGPLKDHTVSSYNPEPEQPAEFTVRSMDGSYALRYAAMRGYKAELMD